MQHVHRFGTCGQIDHAIGPSVIPYADLINARAMLTRRGMNPVKLRELHCGRQLSGPPDARLQNRNCSAVTAGVRRGHGALMNLKRPQKGPVSWPICPFF